MTHAEFEVFYQATRRQLWSYVFRMVIDIDLSNDLVQDTYIRFLREQPRSTSEPVRRSYLYTIATNLIRDSWRRGKVRGRWTDEATSDDIDISAAHLPLRLDVATALAKLPLMQRSLLWLSYVEGYPHAETARMLQIQPDSVRVLLMRARKRMAEVLREMGIEKEDQL